MTARKSFYVIIAGSRCFDDYAMLRERMDYFLSMRHGEDIVILCGEAKGADTLGKQYAHERGYFVESYPADWETHGKGAGFIRNEEMAKRAHALVAFWDGKSRGTKHMIDLAKRDGLKVRVVPYTEG